MKKLLLFLVLSVAAFAAKAQDTLWVKQKEGAPYIAHRVRNGETLFMLAKRYSVPPAILADANQVSYQDGLAEGRWFRIPVDDYNFIRIESVVKSRPIFYRVGLEDDLRSVSRLVSVSQSAIQRWNHLNTPDIKPGNILQLGWVSYDAEQKPFGHPDTVRAIATTPAVQAVKKPAAPVAATASTPRPATPATTTATATDTTAAEIPSAFEELYEQQIQGVSQNEESGAAVFYPLRTKAAPGVYYAFHNTAAKGTILKIMNPANEKIIYAKVIGPVPNLKEYYNSIIGLSGNAAKALGARERRMFCKIKYR